MRILTAFLVTALSAVSIAGTPQIGSRAGTTTTTSNLGGAGDCTIVGSLTGCSASNMSFNSFFSGTNYVWSLSNNLASATFCGPTNQNGVCVLPATAGTYTLTLNYNFNGIPRVCSVNVTVNETIELGVVTGGGAYCVGEEITLTSSLLGGGGTITYSWTVDTGSGPVTIPGATGSSLTISSAALSDAGQYCVTASGTCGPDTACTTVTVGELVDITPLTGSGQYCVGDEITLSTTLLSGAPVTYSWTFDDGSGPVTIPGANTDTLTIASAAVSDTGRYCVTATGACGSEEACAEVSVQECGGGDTFCTLTQGAYGNAGGKFNGVDRLTLITGLMSTDLIVGKPGRSVNLGSGSNAAACVIARLPAGSTATALPAFGDETLDLGTCQTSPTGLPLKNGRYKNVLLGQTIALSLNTRLSPGLSDVGVCGALDTGSGPVNISSKVLTALTNLGLPQTVGGILELANRALAGQALGGASISDANDAASRINEAFDECRTIVSSCE